MRGNIYAVSRGRYLGEFFVFMEEPNKKIYRFLSLPKMKIREIPKHKFHSGVKNKILHLQETLPDDILKVCQAQYDKEKTTTKN
tara:strand:+ start:42 stop:293 length:252 start_codon:yes stop_codon:yes gene_type:complete